MHLNYYISVSVELMEMQQTHYIPQWLLRIQSRDITSPVHVSP